VPAEDNKDDSDKENSSVDSSEEGNLGEDNSDNESLNEGNSNENISDENTLNENTSSENTSNEVKTSVVYKGDNLIQINKRGQYTLSETDWANTDYEVKDATFSFTDIVDAEDELKNGDASVANGSVTFNLPRTMYESTAFPLRAAEDDEGNIVYPIVTCTNKLSNFAYLSSQQNVTNSFTVSNATADTTGTASAQKTARRSVPRDTATSSQAVLNTAVLELKKEDEDE
jgi:hypothetical protein